MNTDTMQKNVMKMKDLREQMTERRDHPRKEEQVKDDDDDG
jgi:hypothetical protein